MCKSKSRHQSCLFAAAIAVSAGFLQCAASAAVLSTVYSGSTSSTVTDQTNFFGLGSSIAAETPYTIEFIYDTSRSTSRPLSLTGSQGFRLVEEDSEQMVVAVNLTLGGTTLGINAADFDTATSTQRESGTSTSGFFGRTAGFNSTTTFTASSVTGESATINANGFYSESSPIGSGIQLQVVPEDLPLLTKTFSVRVGDTLAVPSANSMASVALLLFATDGSVQANISGENAFAVSLVTQGPSTLPPGSEVPLPAGLVLLLTGLASLLGYGKLSGASGRYLESNDTQLLANH